MAPSTSIYLIFNCQLASHVMAGLTHVYRPLFYADYEYNLYVTFCLAGFMCHGFKVVCFWSFPKVQIGRFHVPNYHADDEYQLYFASREAIKTHCIKFDYNLRFCPEIGC
jgi:hypothetical protein